MYGRDEFVGDRLAEAGLAFLIERLGRAAIPSCSSSVAVANRPRPAAKQAGQVIGTGGSKIT
jgi:hypothetical protein